MTPDARDISCIFCGRPARRRLAPSDLPAHDFDCVQCGRYRIGETAEARMRGTGASHYAAVLPKIMWANRSGFRLVLPSCFRVPLAAERAVPIVAQADRPVARISGERLAPREATPPTADFRLE
jgi:hypothetical protein